MVWKAAPPCCGVAATGGASVWYARCIHHGRDSTRSAGCSFRTVIPVLSARDVGHSPLMSVPAAESVEIEGPEACSNVANYDETICVADIDAVGAVLVSGWRTPACVGRAV